MNIGIGLPATIPGVQGKFILDWAKEAEAGPFSSFGIIDRLVYDNYEPLITLAAVAGATSRMRLVTSVLLVPLRNAALFAKQCASLDALSGGRFTLGVGVGGRQDDYQAAGVSVHERGRILDEHMETMTRIWSGGSASEKIGPIGPKPARGGGPEVLFGGYGPAAVRRVARWGDGFISGGVPPQQAQQTFQAVEKAWMDAGKTGKPRFVACTYFGLGNNASEGITSYIVNYYGSFLGADTARQMAQGGLSSPDKVRDAIKGYQEIGADEVILWPCIADLDQVKRLADIIA